MSPEQRKALAFLKDAIDERRLNKQFCASAEFKSALSQVELVLSSSKADGRAIVLSLLGHLSETAAPAAKAIEPILDRLADDEPILPIGLETRKDREYFAKALTRTGAKWRNMVAVKVLVESDPTAKRISTPLLELLGNESSTAQEYAASISNAFLEFKRESSDAETTSFHNRKAVLLFSGIVQYVTQHDMAIGEPTQFGESLARIIKHGVNGAELTRSSKAVESAENILEHLRALLQLRFRDLVTIRSLYSVAFNVQNWWRPGDPPTPIANKLVEIADEGVGALHMFALQGVRDVGLRRALTETLGHAIYERALKRRLAENVRLERLMVSWLETGIEPHETKSSGAAESLTEETIDLKIAELMVAQMNATSSVSVINSIAKEISFTDGELYARLTSALRPVEELSSLVRSLGRLASMVLSPEVGERIKYDPAIHQYDGVIDQGATVIVERAGVIKRRGREERLILKPVVGRP